MARDGIGRRALSWRRDQAIACVVEALDHVADLLRQVGQKDGLWVMKNAGTLADRNIEGHDVSPTVVDFDGDGIPDFLGGAEDGRFYFLKNPRAKR